MRLNKKPEELKIGDKVTSDFYKREIDVVREITSIKKDDSTGSGYRATASPGEKCKCCNHIPGIEIKDVDAAWFNKI